tara:strand:- start:12 stop:266 length:255 start_codon:yes stop_codon:yes gene_type:complete
LFDVKNIFIISNIIITNNDINNAVYIKLKVFEKKLGNKYTIEDMTININDTIYILSSTYFSVASDITLGTNIIENVIMNNNHNT